MSSATVKKRFKNVILHINKKIRDHALTLPASVRSTIQELLQLWNIPNPDLYAVRDLHPIITGWVLDEYPATTLQTLWDEYLSTAMEHRLRMTLSAGGGGGHPLERHVVLRRAQAPRDP